MKFGCVLAESWCDWVMHYYNTGHNMNNSVGQCALFKESNERDRIYV